MRKYKWWETPQHCGRYPETVNQLSYKYHYTWGSHPFLCLLPLLDRQVQKVRLHLLPPKAYSPVKYWEIQQD